jgi:hypothetical protein
MRDPPSTLAFGASAAMREASAMMARSRTDVRAAHDGTSDARPGGMRAIATTSLALALAVSGCERSASGSDEPPRPIRLDNPTEVRFHMRRYVDDLREVERQLVAGNLAAARVRAHLLGMPTPDRGLEPWTSDSAQLSEAARDLAASPGVDEACRRAARVALACASCHARTTQLVLYGAPPALPVEDGTARTRMARHQWAVDRLWEGMVAGSLRPWRLGLDVLAVTPLPFSDRPGAPRFAQRLHDLAREALIDLESGSETLPGRAHAYGEMLVTCAACHALPGSQ